MNDAIALPMVESSQAGEARRMAIALSSRLGFQETERGKVGIVVTEMAQNLVQHAQEGLLVLQPLEQQGRVGLSVLALDKGPGISNIDQCLQDGFSTRGTPGNGLGAIARLSHQWDIDSSTDRGTALLAEMWASSGLQSILPRPEPFEIGAICLPKQGQEVAGDAWAVAQTGDRLLLLVSDGLGHGPQAAQASLEAVRVFQANAHCSPGVLMSQLHQALRSTRGAAIAIAELDPVQQQVRYAGVGNIAATILSGQAQHNLISYNGTVGHEIRKIQEIAYPWYSDSVMILHSDGLSSNWQINQYPGLLYKHSSLMAGVLYRDYSRGRDDTTILVVRQGRKP